LEDTKQKDVSLGLRDLGDRLDPYINTRERDVVKDLYRPCLDAATLYVRGAGFFRTSVFRLMSEDLLRFAIRGGKIVLVTSNQVSKADYDAAVSVYKSGDFFADLEAMLDEPKLRNPVKMLCALIANGNLEMFVVVMREGIYHEKKGYFQDDEGNTVAFDGSGNETASALAPFDKGNAESFNISWNWSSHWEPHGARWFLELQRVYDRDPTLTFPIEHITEVSPEFLEFHEVDIELESHKAEAARRQQTLKKRWDEVYGKDSKPASPDDDAVPQSHSGREPMPHQKDAIREWKAQGSRGILEHATGSGKTFTALTALKEHMAEGKPAIILVPGKLLHRQWAQEILLEIPNAQILKAGDGHNDWRKQDYLRLMTSSSNIGPRITLSTMRTASKPEFIQRVDDGGHLMVIADEVHQVGSPDNCRIFQMNPGKRLGLSATPRRFGDPDGTQDMIDWFGPIVQPPFTLGDAIKAGRLVPYHYYPHAVRLTAGEAEDWKTKTEEICRLIAQSPKNTDGSAKLTDSIKFKLIIRSRIAKKAAAKVALAAQVVADNYEVGESWLVFCEDQGQLGDVMCALDDIGIKPLEYHTAMAGDLDATLRHFKEFGGVLVSIRCLDQGIDIPSLSHALILASSQNPRQFIQRRGRVLRVDPNNPSKFHAVVHDAIVVPIHIDTEPEQTALLHSEMARAFEFAQTSDNLSAAAELRSIAIDIGMDPDDFADTGIELEEEDYE